MNIPASLLSENHKSMQEHDDKMILNENNTSIIQAWEIIPLELCSQNTKADPFGRKLDCESRTTWVLRAALVTSVKPWCIQRTSTSLPSTKCQLRLTGSSAVTPMPCSDPWHWGELCPQWGGDEMPSATPDTEQPDHIPCHRHGAQDTDPLPRAILKPPLTRMSKDCLPRYWLLHWALGSYIKCSHALTDVYVGHPDLTPITSFTKLLMLS